MTGVEYDMCALFICGFALLVIMYVINKYINE